MFAKTEPPIFDVQIQVVGQKLLSRSSRRRLHVRNLQQMLPLDVEMSIEGKFIADQNASSVKEIDLGLLSGRFFDVNGAKFVKLLQNADNASDAVYFQNVEGVESVDAAASSPSQSPAVSSNNDVASSGLALGGIIAIAVCGGLAILLVLVMLYLRCRKPPSRQPVDDVAAKPVAQTPKQPTTKKPTTTKPSASASSAPSGSNYSYEENSVGYYDNQSNLGMDTLQGMDTMSYAYSLDHGIDGSVISSVDSDYMAQSTSGSTIPFEIPMVSSLGTSPAPPAEPKDMFSSPNSNKFTRECFAPPGRLGIVIDTTVEGPVIHKVNPGSPLEGIVWPGDIIVAIDDTDTRALTANEITALMAKNMNQRRKLTIVSDA